MIVANDQARDALPKGAGGKIFYVPDVGVDLSVWAGEAEPAQRPDDSVRFVYLGRLAEWKGVKYLLEAFSAVADQNPSAHLDILGDGEMRDALEEQSRRIESHGSRDVRRVGFGGRRGAAIARGGCSGAPEPARSRGDRDPGSDGGGTACHRHRLGRAGDCT